MKNKKEFFGVLISVLACVFIVALAVYATTTVGDPITVGTDLTVTSGARIGTGSSTTHFTVLGDDSLFIEGNLEVDGTAYFDGTASLSTLDLSSGVITGEVITASSIQAGSGTTSVSYSRFGAGTTSAHHAIAEARDVLFSDEIEVDGTAYFDGVVSISDSNGIRLGDGVKLYGGTASPQGSTLNCTAGDIYFRAGQVSISTGFYYCSAANVWDEAF